MRSPPARGWPGDVRARRGARCAFPARAGMARGRRCRFGARGGVPRPRGDGPPNKKKNKARGRRSPPARGWPVVHRLLLRLRKAFPARAGMARRAPPRPRRLRGVPRPRGDGPNLRNLAFDVAARSPPARGWRRLARRRTRPRRAFPARAGMARITSSIARVTSCVPRPRGDGPRAGERVCLGRKRSPPARGWPEPGGIAKRGEGAFPARERVKKSKSPTTLRHSRERVCEEIERLAQLTTETPKSRCEERQ